jgi:two-component system NtrC family sensor kinase
MTVYSIPPLLSIACFFSLAILTLARGARTRINRLFFILCLLASLIYLNALFASITRSAPMALMASRLEHLFIPLLLPLYIAFFQEYLGISGGKRIVRIASGYAAGLMLLAPTDLYIPHVVKHAFGYVAAAGPLYFLFALGEIATTLYILILLGRNIRRAKTGSRKNRLKYVGVGFGSLGILNGLNFLGIHGFPLYPPGNFSFIPLAVFAVGLFKHDLLDMGILVKKSLIYSCLTAFLTWLYAVLIVVANRISEQFMPSGSLLIPVGFFLLIAFIFGPLKNVIQRFVDRLFDKGTYRYQATLKDLGRQIVTELDSGAIAGKVLFAIEDAMKVQAAALFIQEQGNKGPVVFVNSNDSADMFSGEEVLVRMLEQDRRPLALREIQDVHGGGHVSFQRATWAFPLLFHNKLNGILLLGEKRFGDMFTREDLDLLETVCSQSALALENARSYRRISRLNSQLEKKVADRTKKLSAALREKEKTQDQLIRSESLAAIGQLVAGVAHELNNPLASAISLVQSTVEDLQEEPENREAGLVEDLAFVEKELNRARTIVRSLLGLSRQTDTYQENVDLNAVVKDACQILHNQYRHSGTQITFSLDDSLPEITGNFATLGQVALNIVQNAIQAVAADDGAIVLTTRFVPAHRKVVFECSDSGPGIPPDIQKDVFKPFFTTKDVGQGTGLGLYISHEIVRKHGGSLTLESRPGEGSRFVVALPVADG